jgi:hypothetical protein
MASKYVVWRYKNIDGIVSLGGLNNLPKTSRLLFGKPVAEGYPSDVSMAMREDRPDDTILTDSLLNTDSIVVASEKAVEVLRGKEVTKVEYLPVAIIDHKGKKVKTNYFILNPLEPIADIVDGKASGGKVSPIKPGTFLTIQKLVLDEKKIPADRALFRAAQYPSPVIVRREIAEALDAAGVVGPRWVEPSKYPSE